MLEMANAGKHHRQAVLICRCDHFRVTHRTTRLNHSRDAMFCRFINAVPERKERVRREDRALDWQLGPHRADPHRINARHLTGADADSLPFTSINDCIRLSVLTDGPGEEQRRNLRFCGLTLGNDFEITSPEAMVVASL